MVSVAALFQHQVSECSKFPSPARLSLSLRSPMSEAGIVDGTHPCT